MDVFLKLRILNRSPLCSLCLLVSFVSAFAHVHAAVEQPYETDFEVSDGFAFGELFSLPDWSIGDELSVFGISDSASGKQALSLSFASDLELVFTAPIATPETFDLLLGFP